MIGFLRPLLLALSILAFPLLMECRSAPSARLGGSFLQLTFDHGQWEESRWEGLFDDFQRLGLQELVIQWTVYDDTAFFDSTDLKTVPRPPLETILRLADREGMKVWVGLSHDSGFWEKLQRDPKLVEVYLKRLQLQAERTARGLAGLVARHRSFRGWYISEEIDDRNWLEPQKRRLIYDHLKATAHSLREILPETKLALSGFSTAYADPAVFETFWRQLIEEAALDTLLFQDGVGAGNLELDTLPIYLDRIRAALSGSSCRLQIVVELFRQVSRPDEGFQAQPASLERIERQLEIASRFSNLPPVGFSVPDYMSPSAGASAGALFQDYLRRPVQGR